MKRKHIVYGLLLVLILALGLWYASARREQSTPGASGWWQDETSREPIPTGWVEAEGVRRYILPDGSPARGWMELDGKRHYFLEDGTPTTGWATIDGRRCYFLEDGALATGWVTMDGQRCCFDAEGAPLTGWQDIEGSRYYLNSNGAPLTGIQEIDGQTYVFSEDGTFYRGWVTMDDGEYYCLGDGSFATSPTEIDGEMCYFTPRGIHVVLVNPWTPLPQEQQTDLLQLDSGFFVAVECFNDLNRMLSDCADAGFDPYVCSAYRTQADQEYLFERKVKYYLEKGYEQEEAEEQAGTSVAVPGTSEHQLGLAVDIIERDYPYLNEKQAQTETQKWLMEHCWEYGFILRYPVGSSEITGIIYEPWHYRYVGLDMALELRDLGITLEEYLQFTHE